MDTVPSPRSENEQNRPHFESGNEKTDSSQVLDFGWLTLCTEDSSENV